MDALFEFIALLMLAPFLLLQAAVQGFVEDVVLPFLTCAAGGLVIVLSVLGYAARTDARLTGQRRRFVLERQRYYVRSEGIAKLLGFADRQGRSLVATHR